jgi:hypothetical protein
MHTKYCKLSTKMNVEQKRQPNKGDENMNNVLKEYLVSLGFKVDSQTLNQMKQTLHDVQQAISKLQGVTSAKFATAGAAVTTFVASATISLAHFMSELSKTELRMQMLGRQMFTTTDNATAFANSLNAMGRTMEELYLSPELIAQFKELQKQSMEMRPPAEFKDQMKSIRSISFEFQRLKLETTYAMQWIGYYVYKYLEEPIKKLKISLSGINDYITKNMAKWTQRLAQIVSWVGRLALALYSVKEAIAVVAGAFTAWKLFNLASSPIGLMILGLTTLLLLIDDYNTWQRHGKSLFGDTWQSLKDNGVFEGISDVVVSVKDLFGALLDVGKALADLLLTLAGNKTLSEFADFLEKRIANVLKAIAGYITTIKDLIKGDTKQAETDFSGGNGELFKAGEAASGYLDDISKSISDYIIKIFPSLGGNQAYKGLITPQAYHGGVNQPWIIPQAYQKQKPNTISQSNTFNVYGTEPNATAQLISTKMDGINSRNLKGAII